MATRRGFLAALAALLPAAIAARVLTAGPLGPGPCPAGALGAFGPTGPGGPIGEGQICVFQNFRFIDADWARDSDRTVIVGVRKMADGGKTIVEWLDEYDPPAARIVPAMLPEQPSWLALRNSRW